MGIILAGKNSPKERPYLRNLGIHVKAAEELSYLTLKYPSLFLEGFIGEAFSALVGRSASQPVFAWEPRSYRGENARSEEVLTRSPAWSGYANPRQQNMFLQGVEEYLALPRGRIESKRDDPFFPLRKYGKTADAYERAPADDKLDRTTKSRLLDREGVALANPSLPEHAFDRFQEAYAPRRDRNTIKRMYFLMETETDETLEAHFRQELPETRDNERAHWEGQLREMTSHGTTGREAKKVADISTEQNEAECHACEEKIIT